METDEYVMTDIIFDPEDKRLIHLKGKLVYAGNTPMEVLKEANGKSVNSYSVGAIGAMRRGRLYRFVSKDTSSNYPFIVKEAKMLDKCAFVPERHFPCIIICKNKPSTLERSY